MPTPPTDQTTLKSLLAQIEQLDSDMLEAVNKAVVDRINLLADSNRQNAMAQFSVGDKVSFTDKHGGLVTATVVRLNKKTASLMSVEGNRWNVAPQLLMLVSPIAPAAQLSAISGEGKSLKPSIASGNVQACEWVGGAVKPSNYVIDESGSFRPSAIVWLDGDRMMQGMDMAMPGEETATALASLDEALHRPEFGQPLPPTKIRIADPDIAELVKRHYTSIEVVLAPTPELDEIEKSMREFKSDERRPLTYAEQGLNPSAVASYYQSQAKLYRAAPWKKVPTDLCLLSVSMESLGIDNAVLSIIGQSELDFGMLLFESMTDFEHYLLASDFAQRDMLEHSTGSYRYRAMTFEHGADLHDEIRKEIAANQWPVANAHAYPELFTPADQNLIRPIEKTDLDAFDALAQAVVLALQKMNKLQQAWSGGKHWKGSYTVTSYYGQIKVDLEAPYNYGTKANPLEKMTKLMRTTSEFDWDSYQRLATDISEQFQKSQQCTERDLYRAYDVILMGFLASHCDDTIATAMPSAVEEALFEVFPRKVMVGPDDAQETIDEIRAFYRFLKRQYSLIQADACLELLDDSAVEKLKKALGDGNMMGMGKSFMSGAVDAGFDLSSPEGLEQFMQHSQGMALPDSFPFPSAGISAPVKKPATSCKAADNRKKQRKASRKSRKKNR